MLTCKISAKDSVFLNRENTGLGNVLFQLSSTIGFAIKYHREYSFPDIDILIENLKNLQLPEYSHTIFRNIPTKPVTYECVIYTDKDDGFDETMDLKVFNEKQNLCIGYYLQSHMYFDHCRSKILDIFSIDSNSEIYIKNKYPKLFSNTYTQVSIHIRQNYGGGLVYTIDDYTKMIDYIKKKIDNPLFFICSDNIEWCQNNIPCDLNVIFVSDNPDYIDLWVMSLCKHNIICHSTLGWWGAYLNKNKNKIVVYSEKALKREVFVFHESKVFSYRSDEHYFPNWISM